MKSAFPISCLLFSFHTFAKVVEIERSSAQKVNQVYEEMQEMEAVGPDSKNAWIHEFETDQLGNEMDHLSRLKNPRKNHEEM